jgi:hypothetical protein
MHKAQPCDFFRLIQCHGSFFLPQLILFNEMQTNSTTVHLLKQDRCRKGIEKSVSLTPSEHYDLAYV